MSYFRKKKNHEAVHSVWKVQTMLEKTDTKTMHQQLLQLITIIQEG